MRRRLWLAIPFFFGATLLADAESVDSAPATTPEQQAEARARQQAEAKFAATLYGSEAPKTRARACFVRLYDAAHLKAHPYQKVVEIRISVHYKPVVKPATADAAGESHWGYAIHTRFRDGKQKTFLDDGTCNGAPTQDWDSPQPSFKIRCDAACDAGDDLYVGNDGKKARLKHSDLVHPEVNEPGPEVSKIKADDSVFIIYRAAEADCAFDNK